MIESSKSLQFSIRTLFVLTTITAFFLLAGKRMEFNAIFFWGISLLLSAAVGYLFGWLGRATVEQGCKASVLAFVFIIFNGALWYINNLALMYVDNAKERDRTPIIQEMVDAYQNHYYDVMAIVIPIFIISVASTKNRRLVILLGTFSMLVWLLNCIIGYLSVSISMVDL